MNLNDELKKYIDEQVRAAVEDKPAKANKHMVGRCREARERYLPKLKACNKVFCAYKTADSIKDLCKNAIGLQYIQKATDADINEMADLYEMVCETVLGWAETRST